MDNKKFQIINCMEKAVFDHLHNIINENKTICKLSAIGKFIQVT